MNGARSGLALTRTWVRAGHRVTVVTGAPNFPEGKLYPGYQNRWHQVDSVG